MEAQAATLAVPARASYFGERAGVLIEELARRAGIEIGRELIVRDRTMWADWAAKGMLGIGESYMQGKWDAPRVDVVMGKLAALPSSEKRKIFSSWRNKALVGLATLANRQRRSRELEVAVGHYNLGNDFFAAWLDPQMQYSCAVWKDARTLEEAQLAKMRLLAEKLELRPGHAVLDIGCGWGGFGRFLAREYGARVTGVNISTEQIRWCRGRAAAEGLGEAFETREQSWRDLKGRWDRIVCVGMLEHVGPKNYGDFFAVCGRALAEDGVFVLQTIGSNQSRDALNDRWITTYIFPNGALPSIAQIARAVEKRLVVEDLQNLGPDYDRTLMAWHERFQRIKGQFPLNQTFVRMWEFYLLYTAAGFRERKTQLWQIVMTKRRKDRCDAGRG